MILLQGAAHRFVIRAMLNLQIRQQIQPVRHPLRRLVRRLDQLVQFARGQIQPLIMFRVNDGQLLARLGVKRMLLQMFHVSGSEFRRVRFRPGANAPMMPTGRCF